jgi:transposase
VKYESAGKCWQKFQRRFRDERVPSRQTIYNLVNKLRTTGLLIDKKQKHKRRVLTVEKLDDTRARLEHTARKLQKHLTQETGVSKSSASTTTQLLKLTVDPTKQE